MEDVNLVMEAFKFMALGMGIVFLFLIIMVFALKLQAKLIEKYFPEKQKDNVSEWKPQSIQNNVSDEKDTVAAITAAIIHYNNQKKG
jgi:oxaloacetate decarboxylase (Na+ extruding) subunit gamma